MFGAATPTQQLIKNIATLIYLIMIGVVSVNIKGNLTATN